MSHFTVMVIGNDVEGKLYPFHEVECTLDEEELIEDPRSEFVVEVVGSDVERYIIEEIGKDNIDKYGYREHLHNKDYDVIMMDWGGYESTENGDYGRYMNPKAKWDWYSIGGRWTGMLKLKKFEDVPDEYKYLYEQTEVGEPGLMTSIAENGTCDSAPNILIDWDSMNKLSDDELVYHEKLWDDYVSVLMTDSHYRNVELDEQKQMASKLANELDLGFIYLPQYYLDRYKDKETYLRIVSAFSTYAVIDGNGEWVAPGEMGWFGYSDETGEDKINFVDSFYDKFIKPLDPDTLITIVDCHI